MITLRVLVTGLCFILHGGALGDPNTAGAPSDAITVEQAQTIRQMLQEEQIRPPAADVNQVPEELPVLDALIEELNSLKIAKPAAAPVPAETEAADDSPEKTETPEEPIAEPNTTATEAISTAEPNEAVAVVSEPDLPVSEFPLETIQSIPTVDEPLVLADALYRSGRFQAAQRFYRLHAEKTAAPEDPSYQWALYQNAVCLSATDAAQARKIFQKLVETSPNSPWAGAARAYLATLTWQEELRTKKSEWMRNDPNGF